MMTGTADKREFTFHAYYDQMNLQKKIPPDNYGIDVIIAIDVIEGQIAEFVEINFFHTQK